MIPKSILYKLVVDNVIVKEGNKTDIRRALKQVKQFHPTAFIGLGSPASTLGKVWGGWR